MARVFSGIQPSGELHIGNYLGAVQNWVKLQQQHDCLFCVVDLHAITQAYEAASLSQRTLDMAISLFASGLDPRSEEHTSELQSRLHLVCRLLLEKKKQDYIFVIHAMHILETLRVT